MVTKKIKKILKELESLKGDPKFRFAFSYVNMGKNLEDMEGDVVHNIKEDLASQTLMVIIEDKLFDDIDDEHSMEDVINERETMAKLHMFNLFNRNKKFEA